MGCGKNCCITIRHRQLTLYFRNTLWDLTMSCSIGAFSKLGMAYNLGCFRRLHPMLPAVTSNALGHPLAPVPPLILAAMAPGASHCDGWHRPCLIGRKLLLVASPLSLSPTWLSRLPVRCRDKRWEVVVVIGLLAPMGPSVVWFGRVVSGEVSHGVVKSFNV